MKKAALAALCSALVIPGLGQVMNGQNKKGLALLATVFLLLVAGMFKLIPFFRDVLTSPEPLPETLAAHDYGFLWLLLVIFAVVWFYSVMDAYRCGSKQEAAVVEDSR